MIRMIRTKNLRALKEGAELASALEAGLETAESAIETYKKDAAADAGLRQQLVTDLGEVRTELVAAESRGTDLHRLVDLLLGAVNYAADAAEAPLDVVLHQGCVQGLHRDQESALNAIPIPPAERRMMPTPTPDPDPLGWKIHRATPPPLAPPDSTGEIEALMERPECPALEQLDDAKRRQELTRELETVRSQRDTAIEDTETAAATLIAESVTHAVFRAQVAEIARSIAFALLASDTAASVREVSGLLLKHSEVLGLDPHGSGDGAIDEKGTTE